MLLEKLPKEDGFYVYLIRCVDDSLYCGWTTNLLKRYEKHVNGKGAKYTKAHPPKEVYYFESFEDATAARKREYEIKQMHRQEKLNLVRGKEYVTNNEKSIGNVIEKFIENKTA